jgi:hypothetical protein
MISCRTDSSGSRLPSFSNRRNKMHTGCQVCYCIAKTNLGGQASIARSVGYELLGEEKVQLYPMSILESRVVPKTKSRGPFRPTVWSSFRGLQITSDRLQREEGWLHCEKLLKIYLIMATHDTPVSRDLNIGGRKASVKMLREIEHLMVNNTGLKS